MTLARLVMAAPQNEALIRIYSTYCTLNRAASELLGLYDGAAVDICYDRTQKDAGRLRAYIGKSGTNAFRVRGRGRTCIINSSPLAKALSSALQGQGTYRICPEDRVEFCNSQFYNIFFRKYDKKASI